MARRKETPVKYKNPREGYTFTFEQKQQAIENAHYQCEHCGKYHSRSNRLEINHQVSIWFAREMGISAEIIKSLANQSCLCHECHLRYHQQENRHQYAYLAWYLFGIDVEPDESKDAWRKDPNHLINRQYNTHR